MTSSQQPPVPDERITLPLDCCLCRQPIPPAEDVFALDAEWQRRFPSMVGVLACEECVLETEWTCRDETGSFVPGHIPATGLQDRDSWSHLPGQGSQVSMVQQYPPTSLQDPGRLGQEAAPERIDIGLAEQRTELMGLINAWQTTRPTRARTAASQSSPRSL